MNKTSFVEKKEKLKTLININLVKPDISRTEMISLKELLKILNQYLFENRLEIKGLLSHTIIDSLELDYCLAEKFIEFDKAIQ